MFLVWILVDFVTCDVWSNRQVSVERYTEIPDNWGLVRPDFQEY